MGWPALIGLALTAAGTGVQSYANAETSKNENKVVNNQLAQQQLLQKKANNTFQQNVATGNDADAAKKAVGQNQNQLQTQYANLQSSPTASYASPVSVDPVVQARADASTQNQGAAGAKLQGYTQWGVNQAIQNMLAGQQLGLINNQSSRLNATLGPNLQQAAQSEQGLSGLGGILSTLGTAVGVGGSLLGAGSAAGAVPTAAQSQGLQAGFGPLSASAAAYALPRAQTINTLNSVTRNPYAFLYN